MADARRAQFDALAALEDPYDDAPIGSCATDPDGVVTRINRTLLEWTGYAADEVVGRRRFADFLAIGGKMFYETHFAPTLHLHGHIYEVAFDLVGKDGGAIATLVNAVQRRDDLGQDLFNRITVFKATERRRYEQELLLARRESERAVNDLARTIAELSRANQALARVNDELSQFTHAASHDLQAPLRGVAMYADLLARRHGERLDDTGRQYLERLRSGAARMQDLVRDLLDLSQAGGAIRREPTALAEVLDDVLQLLDADVRQCQALIERDALPVVPADRRQLSQLLRNLLANALKYRHPERVPRIRLSARDDGQSWEFAVHDNGVGFPMKHAERIFEPFKRLHGSDIPGTGIGLALCRKVVAAHGGKIWAESTPGEGSVFRFTLPREGTAGG